jgi:hypothetical protein
MGDQLDGAFVFVSYARVDDLPSRGVPFGWVSNLHFSLERALSRQIGGSCSIWFDRSELRGNLAVTPEIANRLAQTQVFVAVVSPAFVRSEWCLKELALFRQRYQGNDNKRIFVVDLAGLERDQLIEIGLGDLVTYRFWYCDESKRTRIFGSPEPAPSEREYYRLVDDLATDIADILKETNQRQGKPAKMATAVGISLLANEAISNPPESNERSNKQIVLADVTDDLESSRQQLRRYLEQAGFSVYLCQSFGATVAAFQNEVRDELQRATMFVQLLSHVPSRTVPSLPEGYANWQYQCAKEFNTRILQWRAPSIVLEQIEDSAHRQLLLQDAVCAVPFESFKKMVIDAINNDAPHHPPLRPNSFFINAERRDVDLAHKIRDHIGQHAWVFLPVTSGKPEEIRQNIEDNIIECDGLLVIYGDGSAAWVQQQLRLYNKLTPRRERPIKLLAVIDAPPDEKPDLNVHIPGLRVLNCRKGIDEAALLGALSDISSDQLH